MAWGKYLFLALQKNFHLGVTKSICNLCRWGGGVAEGDNRRGLRF